MKTLEQQAVTNAIKHSIKMNKLFMQATNHRNEPSFQEARKNKLDADNAVQEAFNKCGVS